MKTTFFVLACLLVTSSQIMAQQQTTGFYFNPSINAIIEPRTFSQPNFIQPQLAMGYLWGQKNRHNVSVSGLTGGIGKYYSHIGLNLKYSYDIRLYQHKRWSFYLSPYASTGFNMMKSKDVSQSNFSSRGQNYFATAGIAPSVEYQLGRNVKFVFSLPVSLLGYTYNHNSTNNQGVRQEYHNGSQRFMPSLGANLGVRINLSNR